MAAVKALKIDTGPITARAYLSEIARADWGLLVGARRTFLNISLPHDCRELLRFVTEAQEMFAPLGYASLTDFIRRGLDLDPALVQWAVEGLRTLKPDEPIPFTVAVENGRARTQACAEKATPLAQHRRPTKEEQDNKGRHTTLNGKRDADYYTARIARDHPAILTKMQAGEYRSVRAAAKDAGILKEATILEKLTRLWGKASPAEQREFLAFIAPQKTRRTA